MNKIAFVIEVLENLARIGNKVSVVLILCHTQKLPVTLQHCLYAISNWVSLRLAPLSFGVGTPSSPMNDIIERPKRFSAESQLLGIEYRSVSF